jgi:hypothetical protein
VDETENLIYSGQYWLTSRSKNEPRKVLVNGSPKSGTTWMLKLVTSIPGYQMIGNFDGDIERYKDVQPGQVVHGHDQFGERIAQLLSRGGIKTVLMVRDPRDQLISRVYHIRRDEKHAWHNEFKNLSIEQGINLCIEGRDGLPGTRTLIGLTQSWLVDASDKAAIRYERLLADPLTQFQMVLDYLEIDLSAGFIDSIIRRNQFERLAGGRKFWRDGRKQGQADPSSHYRKGIAGDWRNYLNESQVKKFKQVAGDQLIELGYEHDLDW